MDTVFDPRLLLVFLALAACDRRPLPGPDGSEAGGLPERCAGRCDAKAPAPPAIGARGAAGDVTMYSTSASDGGACNYGSTPVMYYAAINVNVLPGDGKGQWQHGRSCGQCAEVTVLTSSGPRTVVVRVMDKCPDRDCGVDLGGAAPDAIMLDGHGRYAGTWRLVSCAGHPEVSGGIPRLAVLPGSNRWWSRVQVRDAAWPVATLEWREPSGVARGAFPYATDPENAFEVPASDVLGSSAATVRVDVTLVDGSSASVHLSPAQLASENAEYPLQ